MTRDEVRNAIVYQTGALLGFMKPEGMELHHIKPHGSLYFMAMQQEAVAHGVCDAAEIFGVPLFGMTGTLHEEIYQARGIPFVAEFYADLEYNAQGKLILTRVHDAKDPAKMAERCVRAITEGKGTAEDGTLFPVRCETICVHSDTPNAIDIARAVKDAIAPWH